MTHEEFFSAAFLASLPIARKIAVPGEVVVTAHKMALEAMTYWEETLPEIHKREAGK